jgi:hypothetical protein
MALNFPAATAATATACGPAAVSGLCLLAYVLAQLMRCCMALTALCYAAAATAGAAAATAYGPAAVAAPCLAC